MPSHMAAYIDGYGKSRDMGGIGLNVKGQSSSLAAEALRADAGLVDGFQHVRFQLGIKGVGVVL